MRILLRRQVAWFPNVPRSGMRIAMTSFLPASTQSFLLAWCDQRFQLLALPFVDLMDLLSLLRGRERGVCTHRLNLLTRLLHNLTPLLHCRLGDACNLPAGFLPSLFSTYRPPGPPTLSLRSRT